MSGGSSGGVRFAGRVASTLFFVVFLGVGLLFLVLLGRAVWRGAETWSWAERRCEIASSTVVRADGEDPYHPVVVFRLVDGLEPQASQAIRRDPPHYGTYDAAAAHAARYPAGAHTACWASPAGELVLERSSLWIALFLLLPLVFVAVGTVGIARAWRSPRSDPQGRPLPERLGDARSLSPGLALVLFGAVFALVGGLLFWFLALAPFARVYEARSWERRTCTVEQSAVVSHDGDEGTTYSVDMLYRWERGRGVERSSRYSFFGGSSSGYAAKAEVVRAHPPGADVTCWVDPVRRDEAVLVPGLTGMTFLALLPLVFLLAGVAMLVGGLRARRRDGGLRSRNARGELAIGVREAQEDGLPAALPTSGPATLAPESSRAGRVLAVAFAAVFWNGIVSVFAFQASGSFERGSPDWFLTVFLLPFLAVGIGLVGAFAYALLALRNPRPQLVLGARALHPGAATDLSWRFLGAAQRLGRVRISLQGMEHATYRVGTDSRTATETFHDQVLVDAPAPTCAAGGSLRLAIPSDAMHSFESTHNKITWQLAVHGEIRRWPDADETFPLVVLPGPGARE
jgi:hypothetical protein